MKAVILAGGLGTRLREETEYRPKPMVEIGNRPIVWHLMKNLSAHGISKFTLALGYKGDYIKDFFLHYSHRTSDLLVKLAESEVSNLSNRTPEDWQIELIDTGALTQTGGRIFKLRDYFKQEEFFLCTYGDGLANVNIPSLVDFHLKHGKIATVTAAKPTSRFGRLEISEVGIVKKFAEKTQENDWVNAGFFIFNKKIFNYLDEESILERAPLETLSREGELVAFKHDGFWQPMDTVREVQLLNQMWAENSAPWKNWQ